MKFYRGSAAAARTYVEAERSRVDDYYLSEGTGVATLYVAGPEGLEARGERAEGHAGGRLEERGERSGEKGERSQERGPERGPVSVRGGGTLDGDAYERWVAGYDKAGVAKGRLRGDEHGLRFVEFTVNGPKTWSLAASLHPAVAQAYDAAQDRAAGEVIGWLAEHATTRVGPRGRQVLVGVDEIEAAVVRHYTSRAGDPHRHLHVQLNARVRAGGGVSGVWRGLHSVGVVDSIEAINGIGQAAVMCDPHLRQTLAAHGFTLDPESGEVRELAAYAGAFSARASQISRNVDRYEAAWRREHPGTEPGPKLRRVWDRRAWADARPDKVIPESGADLARRWVEELHDLGYKAPVGQAPLAPTPVGVINRNAVVHLALSRLGARRSAWNAADIRGEVEKVIASAGDHGVVVDPRVRRELAEDLTARTVAACTPLLERPDVPGHVRALTSQGVLDVEADLVDRLAARATTPGTPGSMSPVVAGVRLDQAQQRTVAALAGTGRLVVIEGAAGAGKTTTLAAARAVLEMRHRQLVVVAPTLKAAQVADTELGTPAFSAAWLVHQHGYRWDEDGHWTRHPVDRHALNVGARLMPGDLLLIDEAGMLDQDTARALVTVADETGARIALLGDRHQLPAVGRGGVLDHAARWAHPTDQVTLDAVHRFTDPTYADLTLKMRTGVDAGHVFDQLLERGDIVIHPSDVERHAAVADLAAATPGDLVIADTREQVAALNATIRDRRRPSSGDDQQRTAFNTYTGDQLAVGDRVATRRNDRDLGVANRDQWTITAINEHTGDLTVSGRRGTRTLPADYAARHAELAYATTVHGAQGETVAAAHFLLGETTGAASAYVAMTRGRQFNTAHLVADTPDDARRRWVETFTRDRADLGPAHSRDTANEAIDTYGPLAPPRPRSPRGPDGQRRPPAPVPALSPGERPGIRR